MKNRVAIIMIDSTVIVDSEAYIVQLPEGSEQYHAIQWYSETGEIEFSEHALPNKVISGKKDYNMYVLPYIAAWEDAKAEATAPPLLPTQENLTLQERQKLISQLSELDATYLTPRTLAGLTIGDEYAHEQYSKHESLAAPLRSKLVELE